MSRTIVPQTLVQESRGVRAPFDAASLGWVNVIAPGTGVTNRISQGVRLQRMFLQVMASAVTAASRMRVVVGYDRDHNGATLTAAQLQSILFSTGSPLSFYCSPYRPDLVGPGKRMQILYDKMQTLNISGGATDSTTRRMMRKIFNLKGRTVTYNNGSTNTDTDIDKYALFVLITSDHDVASAASPIFDIDVQLRWSNDL